MPNNLDHQAFRASEFTGTRRSLDWKDGAHAARHRAPQVNDSNAPATEAVLYPAFSGNERRYLGTSTCIGYGNKDAPSYQLCTVVGSRGFDFRGADT
jgi:hypothetical protein